MSQENVKKFMELLSKDEELQKKVKEATESYTGDKTNEKAVFEAVILPIAKEAGYEFSFEDAEELAKAAQDDELSEDEVAAAAGGVLNFNLCFGIGITMNNDTGNPSNETIVETGCDAVLGGATACKIIGVGFGRTWDKDTK